MVLRRVALALVLLLLLGASLAAKIVRYNTHLGNGREVAEAQITATLGQQGFTAEPTLDLVTGGVVRALRFAPPICREPLLVVVLAGNAEGDELLRQYTDPAQYKMSFVYGGVESDDPPLTRFLTIETVRAIGRAVGLHVAQAQPMLGVANPIGCADRPKWPALW